MDKGIYDNYEEDYVRDEGESTRSISPEKYSTQSQRDSRDSNLRSRVSPSTPCPDPTSLSTMRLQHFTETFKTIHMAGHGEDRQSRQPSQRVELG